MARLLLWASRNPHPCSHARCGELPEIVLDPAETERGSAADDRLPRPEDRTGTACRPGTASLAARRWPAPRKRAHEKAVTSLARTPPRRGRPRPTTPSAVERRSKGGADRRRPRERGPFPLSSGVPRVGQTDVVRANADPFRCRAAFQGWGRQTSSARTRIVRANAGARPGPRP